MLCLLYISTNGLRLVGWPEELTCDCDVGESELPETATEVSHADRERIHPRWCKHVRRIHVL